jgi:hypothetical protein
MSEELEQVQPEEVLSEAPQEEVTTTEADAVEETDEEKNERVQREAAEKAEKRTRGIQKRIDELTADKHAERKRADDLAQQNARILALLEEKRQPAKTDLSRDQFEDEGSYVLALARQEAERIAEQKIQRMMAEQQQLTQRQMQEQEQAQVYKQFIEREEQAKKEIPDFTDTVQDWSPSLPPAVTDMILRLQDGPLIAYHLAKNPDLERQFNTQPEYMHGVILGQLIATIKGNKQTTKAPPVGKPVASTSSGNANEPPSDPEKYLEWAKKHMR